MLQDTVVQDTGRNSPNQNDIDAQRDENEEVEEEERRETGTVKFAVYKTYWKVKCTQNASCFGCFKMITQNLYDIYTKAVGSLLSPTILLSLLAMQVGPTKKNIVGSA